MQHSESSSDFLCLLLSKSFLTSASKECIHFGFVFRGDNEVGEVFLHLFFSQSKHNVELVPELFLIWHGCFAVHINVTKTHLVHDFHSCLESRVVFQMCELTQFG